MLSRLNVVFIMLTQKNKSPCNLLMLYSLFFFFFLPDQKYERKLVRMPLFLTGGTRDAEASDLIALFYNYYYC